MVTGFLTVAVVWCLLYGRIPMMILLPLCLGLGAALPLLGRHGSGQFLTIDVLAQTSRLNRVSPLLKFWTVLVLMVLCVSATSPAVGLFLTVLMLILTVCGGGLALHDYIHLLALPLSFLLLGREVSITDYLIWGGFPKRFEFNSMDAQRRYLNDLDDTIIINDLVRRHKIRKESLFKHLVNFILRSNSRIVSAKSIHDYIKKEHASCSINTIMKYLDYLEEAYIIESVKRYSTRTKRELSYYYKIYDTDVCFNSLRCMDNRFELTHNLENIIYNELIYMGYTLWVYDNAGKEIDFLAQKENKKYFIQVAYSVVEEKAYTREFGAFHGIDHLSQKILITNDDIDYSTSVVRHIKLKDFLLMNSLDDK